MNQRAIVIGAGGGIGQEVVKQLLDSEGQWFVHCISRHGASLKQAFGDHNNIEVVEIDSIDEEAVASYCQSLSKDVPVTRVICCIGALHGTQNGVELFPEKRLEDVNSAQLQSYFLTNTIAPMLWLKYLAPVLKSAQKCQFVLMTARVGSISDNRLGGWYGYRASKAALNMLIKTSQVEYQRRAKNVELISYHPGTVDTDLSQPFQGNVAKTKLFTPAFTVSSLFASLDTLKIDEAPHYIDWNNQPIPW